MTSPPPSSSPGVRFPPPILFVAGLVVGWLLDREWHALPVSRMHVAGLESLGSVLVVAGVALAGWGMVTFRRAGTAIIPSNPASALVGTGPYRFTRNPMYTGMTIVYLGAAAILDSAWPVLLLPLVISALIVLVISREEAYLTQAFGADYRAYQARVRRWL